MANESPGLTPNVLIQWMCMADLGRMDQPQPAQMVRSVEFPSARYELPLLGTSHVPLSSHQVQRSG